MPDGSSQSMGEREGREETWPPYPIVLNRPVIHSIVRPLFSFHEQHFLSSPFFFVSSLSLSLLFFLPFPFLTSTLLFNSLLLFFSVSCLLLLRSSPFPLQLVHSLFSFNSHSLFSFPIHTYQEILPFDFVLIFHHIAHLSLPLSIVPSSSSLLLFSTPCTIHPFFNTST